MDPATGVLPASDGRRLRRQGPLPLGAGHGLCRRRGRSLREPADGVAGRHRFFFGPRTRGRPGAVVWLTTVVSMAVIELMFPGIYGGSLAVVAFEAAMLMAYLALAWMAARERPP